VGAHVEGSGAETAAVTTTSPDRAGEPQKAPLAQRVARLPKPRSQAERTTQKWSRWLHVYTSMISLMLVLFFAITGLTLNHPDWTFGDDTETSTVTGNFPFEVSASGEVDYLAISEFVRAEHSITAPVGDYRSDATSGEIDYRGPGYTAELRFDRDASTYDLTVTQQGWVGVMNDLHKGRDTTSTWKWVIDISAIVLAVVALTGLVLQIVLAKRRRSALLLALAGTIIGAALIYWTMA
jgi:hypothetical protein